MELIVKGSFYRDVMVYKDKRLLILIYEAIQGVESASSISAINNFKKLRKYKTLYRIKIGEDHRIGIVVRKNKMWFVCFGHRSKFYQKFP